MVRNSIMMRGALALLAGYAVAVCWQVALARWLPMSRIDATITATMISFPIYAAAAIWSFAAHSATRAAMGLLGAIAVALLLWWPVR
jgi:hypothetical protein